MAHAALRVDVAVADGCDKTHVRRQCRKLRRKLQVEQERPSAVDRGVRPTQHHLQAVYVNTVSPTPHQQWQVHTQRLNRSCQSRVKQDELDCRQARGQVRVRGLPARSRCCLRKGKRRRQGGGCAEGAQVVGTRTSSPKGPASLMQLALHQRQQRPPAPGAGLQLLRVLGLAYPSRPPPCGVARACKQNC